MQDLRFVFVVFGRLSAGSDVYRVYHTTTSSRNGMLSIVPFLCTQIPATYIPIC